MKTSLGRNLILLFAKDLKTENKNSRNDQKMEKHDSSILRKGIFKNINLGTYK